MIEFKASTKQGKNIIDRASVYEGYYLSDVYGTHSNEKENSWRICHDMYISTENSSDFHICSHNTFQYSVAWYGTKDGEKILRVETANNSFLVWLER